MGIISSFSIRGLYGERDVNIKFDDDIKILVAENGYGKTTVLNTLYALLSGNIQKLMKVEFSSIEIVFSNSDSFAIQRSEIELLLHGKFDDSGLYNHFKELLGEMETLELFSLFNKNLVPQIRSSPIFKSAVKKTGLAPHQLISLLSHDYKRTKDLSNLANVKNYLNEISSKFPFSFLYLPTYRRVEQDLRDLGLSNDGNVIYDHAINFGMRDVDQRIKEVTKEILTSSVEWFSKVNGQMLSQLVDGFKIDSELIESIKKPDAIRIVLDRIGNNIDNSYKDKIVRLIDSGDIFHGHDPLIYFISNLSKVYEQQKENDKAIQDFTIVCNKYLVDKELVYNESTVTLNILRKKNKGIVNMENLSSGEKQIISLFSKLYLPKEGKDAKFGVFFDEPELSLSMEWQKTLLPDILNSGKCAFLFATTHSPFIFENNLISKTSDLGSCIKEL